MGGTTTTRFGIVFYSDTKGADQGMDNVSRRLDIINRQLLQLTGLAQQAAHQTVGFFARAGISLVQTASKLELTRTKFEFAFRKMDPADVVKRWQAVEVAGLKTVQTTNAIAESMALLQQMTNADVFSDKATASLKKAMPSLTNFAELFGDIASGSQFGERSALWGLKALLQGEYGSAGKHLDSIGGKMNEYKKAIGGSKDAAQNLIKIMPLLARDFGGASEKMGSTFSFLVDQLGDIHDKLYGTFGKPMMDQLKGPLKDFLSFWVGEPDGLLLPQNINKLDGLKDIFEGIGRGLNTVAKQFVEVVKGASTFLAENPRFMKVALSIMGVVAAVSALMVVLLTAKIAAFALAAAFSGWSIPIIAVGAALAAAAYWMIQYKFGSFDLLSTWKMLKLVFGGVVELISSMKNGIGSISSETMKKLQFWGLENFVIGIGKFMYRVHQFFSGIVEGFQKNSHALWRAVGPILFRLSSWLGVMDLGANTASISWKKVGETIANVFTKAVQIVSYAIDKIMGMLEWAKKHPIMSMWLLQKSGLPGTDNSITRNPISSYIMGSNAGWFAQHPILAYLFARGSGIIGGKDKKPEAQGLQQSASTGIPVYVTNWPVGGIGGGAGGGGEDVEQKRALFDATTLTWIAGAIAAYLRGKLIWAIGSAIAGAMPAVLSVLTPVAGVLAWTYKGLTGLFQSDWWKIKQLSPEQAKDLADKAKKAEEEAPKHRSTGMQAAMEAEAARLAARRNGAGNPVSNNINIYVDGKKIVEKRVEMDADRTGRGADVTSVP